MEAPGNHLLFVIIILSCQCEFWMRNEINEAHKVNRVSKWMVFELGRARV